MEILDIEFEDAEEIARANPDTFEIDPLEDRESIVERDYVKVCFNQERFWVKVEKIVVTEAAISFVGVVDNDLVLQTELKCGDYVKVYPKNIYQILKEDEA